MTLPSDKETRLLMLCGPNAGSPLQHTVFQEAGTLCWDRVVRQAAREEILPLLYHRLHQAAVLDLLPHRVQEELTLAYYGGAAAATLRHNQLRRVLALFKEAGVAVMPLKGILLAEHCYDNPALRPMVDIDLLIRSEDLQTVHCLLDRAGYRGHGPDRTFNATGREYLTSRHYRPIRGNGAPLHLHTHLLNSSIPNGTHIASQSMDEIWQAAEAVTICGQPCLSLAPEQQILHLAEHSLRVPHSLTKLRYLYDLAYAVNHYRTEIDWHRLCQLAEHWRLRRLIYYPLLLSARWLRVPIPHSTLVALQPEPDPLHALFALLLRHNLRRPGYSYLLHLAEQPTVRARCRFIGRTLFPPRAVLARRCGIGVEEVNARTYLRRLAEAGTTLCWLTSQGLKKLAGGAP